jgi:hypothetical protein
MHGKHLVIAYLMTLCMGAVPGASAWAGQPVRYDTSVLEVRSFQKGQLDAYRNQKDFNYARQRPAEMDWWERFKMWVVMKVSELFQYKAVTVTFRFLLWAMSIGIVLYAILRIIGLEKVMVFITGRKEGALPYVTGDEDIHAIDFDNEIDGAIARGEYRQAVRLQYLRTLRILSEKGRIGWKASKTNIDYLSELSGTPLEDGFRKVTRVFEYAWYGEMDIPAEQYERTSEWFRSFNKTVAA